MRSFTSTQETKICDEVGIYGENATKAVALLYKDCETALDRKLERAEKIIALGETRYNEIN